MPRAMTHQDLIPWLKSRAPALLMTAFALMGAAGLLVISEADRDLKFYVANGLMHIPLVLGWFVVLRINLLERRLDWFWTPYFAFTICWVFVTVIMTTVTYHGISGFARQSETFWYALSYGSLFMFFRLESARPLWHFMIFIAVFWNLQTVLLTSQALGVDLMMEGPPSLDDYFDGYEGFWQTWGWLASDLLVDIPISAAALYFIARGWMSRVAERRARRDSNP